MAKYKGKDRFTECSASDVDKAIATFTSTDRLVDDEKEAIKDVEDPEHRRKLRAQMNLEFRERVLTDVGQKNIKGQLSTAQKEALRAAALVGTKSLKDFAFCARVTVPFLKEYLKKNVRFGEELALLGNTVTMAAKRNIASEIENGSIGLSQWWLERHPDSDFNPNNSAKEERKPIVIIMPNGKQPEIEPQEGEVVREEEDAGYDNQTLTLAS